MDAVKGHGLEPVGYITVVDSLSEQPLRSGSWALRGITSNERYVERAEKRLLTANQPPLGRAEATHAALIPIKKSAAWWNLPQDERRAIFEAQSQHIRIGMDFLPAIARKLHHCRDLGDNEPLDFLTWFEYAAHDAPAFDKLVSALRSTIEWTYVEREVDIRLVRCDAERPR
jgi:chlorite dismutase